MHTPNDVDVSPLELSDNELETVAGGRSFNTTLMQAISDAMKKISDAANSAISNIR
jgi:hypothetical protein